MVRVLGAQQTQITRDSIDESLWLLGRCVRKSAELQAAKAWDTKLWLPFESRINYQGPR